SRRLPPQERVLGPSQDCRRHIALHADRRRTKVRRQHHQGLRPAPASETNQLQDQVVQGGNMATAFWRKDVKAWGIGYKTASGKWKYGVSDAKTKSAAKKFAQDL